MSQNVNPSTRGDAQRHLSRSQLKAARFRSGVELLLDELERIALMTVGRPAAPASLRKLVLEVAGRNQLTAVEILVVNRRGVVKDAVVLRAVAFPAPAVKVFAAGGGTFGTPDRGRFLEVNVVCRTPTGTSTVNRRLAESRRLVGYDPRLVREGVVSGNHVDGAQLLGPHLPDNHAGSFVFLTSVESQQVCRPVVVPPAGPASGVPCQGVPS